MGDVGQDGGKGVWEYGNFGGMLPASPDADDMHFAELQTNTWGSTWEDPEWFNFEVPAPPP